MRLFGRGLILAALLCAFAPSVASGTPIVVQPTTERGCGGIVLVTTDCTVFSIGSLTGLVELEGSFETDSDVALFEFIVDANSTFSAQTTSYLTTGFNSMLGLFDASTLLNVTAPDPTNENQPAAVRGADISADNLDDQLGSFALGPGTYYLALLNNNSFANGFSIDFVSGLDSLSAGFGCDDPSLCIGAAAAGSFALSFQAIPDVDPPQPVPEPGTLALLGGGAVAALVRRRSRKRNP